MSLAVHYAVRDGESLLRRLGALAALGLALLALGVTLGGSGSARGARLVAVVEVALACKVR